MKFKVQFIKDRHLVALEVIQDANIDKEDKTVVNISVRIFLGGYLDSAFLTRNKFSIFKFSERFLEISCRDLTLYSLY